MERNVRHHSCATVKRGKLVSFQFSSDRKSNSDSYSVRGSSTRPSPLNLLGRMWRRRKEMLGMAGRRQGRRVNATFIKEGLTGTKSHTTSDLIIRAKSTGERKYIIDSLYNPEFKSHTDTDVLSEDSKMVTKKCTFYLRRSQQVNGWYLSFLPEHLAQRSI